MATNETSKSSTANAGMAPEPDDERKPDSPTDLTKASWKYLLRKTLREFNQDQCADLAAGLTYYAIFSLFPALLALVSLLGIFGQAERSTAALLGIVQRIAPGQTVELVRSAIEGLTTSPAAGFALLVGLAVALWSASGYVMAFSRAMSRIYERDEGRGFIKLRGTMLAVTVVTLIIVALLAAMLVISGPVAEAVGAALGLGDMVLTIWNIAKWPVILGLVIMVIAILYYVTPNVRQPKFRWLSIGSSLALLVFVVTSLALGFYVGNFGNYNKTYGAIGGVIVMLSWLWILNLSLLFGAEVDAEMERARELQAGIAAEKTIQLPARDTRASVKRQEQEEEDIRRGRELRLQSAVRG